MNGSPDQTILGADLEEMSSRHERLRFRLLEGDTGLSSRSLC